MAGENPPEEMEGSTTKLLAVAAEVPEGVVTVSEPVAAPAGTVTDRELADTENGTAVAPANATCVAPLKLVPLI